jgi:hypothetical protein
MPQNLAERLIGAEVAAARIEAILLADPDLGLLWRAQAALSEAVRSLALEDVPLREGDLVVRLSENRTGDLDARGAETAAAALRMLRHPRDILAEPVETVRAIEAALAPAAVDGSGARDIHAEADRLADAEIREIVADLRERPVSPVLGALRAAAAYGSLTGRRAPMAERMIFVAAEGALRRDREVPMVEVAREPGLLLEDFAIVSASWVALPASALLRRGFRLWSPVRVEGVSDFLDHLALSLSWEIGQIGQLRHWLARARGSADSAKGRSRRADLMALAAREPLLSSGRVMEALGVSRRTAITLLDQSAEMGLLKVVTPRNRWRLWAAAPFAERLGANVSRARQASRVGTWRLETEEIVRTDALQAETSRGSGDPDRAARLREEGRQAIEEAGQALDRAMAEAEKILGRWPKRT